MPEETIPIFQVKDALRAVERRTQRRIPCDLILCCRPLRRRKPLFHLVNVANISTAGVGLVLDRRVTPGTILAIELQRQQRVARTLLARVAHATANDDDTWTIGCEFANRLTHRELQDLLA